MSVQKYLVEFLRYNFGIIYWTSRLAFNIDFCFDTDILIHIPFDLSSILIVLLSYCLTLRVVKTLDIVDVNGGTNSR